MKKEDDCTGKAVQATEEILFTNASSVVLPVSCIHRPLSHGPRFCTCRRSAVWRPYSRTQAPGKIWCPTCVLWSRADAGNFSIIKKKYELCAGDVVFIDCHKPYSHRTDQALWTLQWCHFYGPDLPAVYNKYLERGGQPVFHPEDDTVIRELLAQLYVLAGSADYHPGICGSIRS